MVRFADLDFATDALESHLRAGWMEASGDEGGQRLDKISRNLATRRCRSTSNLDADWRKWSRAEHVLAVMGTLLMAVLPLGLLITRPPGGPYLSLPGSSTRRSSAD